MRMYHAGLLILLLTFLPPSAEHRGSSHGYIGVQSAGRLLSAFFGGDRRTLSSIDGHESITRVSLSEAIEDALRAQNAYFPEKELNYTIAEPSKLIRFAYVEYYWSKEALNNASRRCMYDEKIGEPSKCIIENDGNANVCSRKFQTGEDALGKAHFENGERPESMYWKCSDECCEWECCVVERSKAWIALIPIVVVAILVGLICYKGDPCERRRRRKMREQELTKYKTPMEREYIPIK